MVVVHRFDCIQQKIVESFFTVTDVIVDVVAVVVVVIVVDVAKSNSKISVATIEKPHLPPSILETKNYISFVILGSGVSKKR